MASASPADVTEPPLDVLKPLAENLWIVDSGPQVVMRLVLPVRMTVVRLGSGGLWLHSPTRFDPNLKRELDALGPIHHLVAPSLGHWTHLKEWQAHCPGAIVWAAPNLRKRPQVRATNLRIDRDLGEDAPEDWRADIAQTVVEGAAGFREVAFFHQPSRSLILTDLIQNLEPGRLPTATRLFARATGSTRPGRIPRHVRLLLSLRAAQARAALARVLAWAPERVIFAHGQIFASDGTARLRAAFGSLAG